MTYDKNTLNVADTRLDWVDPVVTTLELGDTAGLPRRGGDRGAFVDCTRS